MVNFTMRAGLSCLILFCGCRTISAPPAPDDVVDIPQQWSGSAESSADVDETWWFSFQDPNLRECVKEALAYNHDLKAAVARFDIAAAQVRLAGARLQPQLDGTLSGQRQRENFIGFPIGDNGSGQGQSSNTTEQVFNTTFNSFTLQASASWEIDLWGRLRAARQAAFADFQASQAQLQAAHLSIAAQTAKSWFALVEARRQLQLVEETIETYRRTQQQVQLRVDSGVASPVELQLAINNRASAEALLRQRQIEVELAVRRLEILLGRYPGGAIHTRAVLPAVSQSVPAGLPSDLLQRRLDIVAAEKELAAQRIRIEEARTSLFPQISLTASAGTRSEQFHNLMDSDFFIWSVGGNLLQPLFDGGTRLANIDLAKGQARLALADYANTILQAFLEVESALVSETRLHQRQQRLHAAARSANKARQLSQARYEQGIDDLLTVLEAQRRALDSQSALISVQRQRLDNRVDLHLALGGNFRIDHQPRKTDLTLDLLLRRQDIMESTDDHSDEGDVGK